MKNILLLTDFSENSKNAINYALQLFGGDSCDFYILNIQKSSQYTTDDLMSAPANQSIYESVLSQNKKQLKKHTDTLRKDYVHEKYLFHELIDYDAFIDAVKQAVIFNEISLIIMGSNGATNASEVLFGSNALNVIRKVNCPVLVIPSTFVYQKPKTVLYAIDSDREFSSITLGPLKNLVNMHKSSIRILKITEEDVLAIGEYDNKKDLKKFFEDSPHTFHAITNVHMPLAIDSFVQLMNVNMTAIVIERTSFIRRFFSGSDNIAEISYTNRTPLLIMHPIE